MSSSSREVSQTSSASLSAETLNPMYWMLTLIVVVVDVITKALAVKHLVPRHVPHEFLGDYVRFTLAYNPGAAFGFNLGPASRWIFATLSVVIVVVLLRSTRELVLQTKLAAYGVPIVIGGAIGNLLDRVRFREGVVDFIDVGVGSVRFWTFNVADSAVTVGAVCLVLALWRHDLTTARS
ncbi:MAG: signal peptidase II [Gemmatimonadaceae bacterium]